MSDSKPQMQWMVQEVESGRGCWCLESSMGSIFIFQDAPSRPFEWSVDYGVASQSGIAPSLGQAKADAVGAAIRMTAVELDRLRELES